MNRFWGQIKLISCAAILLAASAHAGSVDKSSDCARGVRGTGCFSQGFATQMGSGYNLPFYSSGSDSNCFHDKKTWAEWAQTKLAGRRCIRYNGYNCICQTAVTQALTESQDSRSDTPHTGEPENLGTITSPEPILSIAPENTTSLKTIDVSSTYTARAVQLQQSSRYFSDQETRELVSFFSNAISEGVRKLRDLASTLADTTPPACQILSDGDKSVVRDLSTSPLQPGRTLPPTRFSISPNKACGAISEFYLESCEMKHGGGNGLDLCDLRYARIIPPTIEHSPTNYTLPIFVQLTASNGARCPGDATECDFEVDYKMRYVELKPTSKEDLLARRDGSPLKITIKGKLKANPFNVLFSTAPQFVLNQADGLLRADEPELKTEEGISIINDSGDQSIELQRIDLVGQCGSIQTPAPLVYLANAADQAETDCTLGLSPSHPTYASSYSPAQGYTGRRLKANERCHLSIGATLLRNPNARPGEVKGCEISVTAKSVSKPELGEQSFNLPVGIEILAQSGWLKSSPTKLTLSEAVPESSFAVTAYKNADVPAASSAKFNLTKVSILGSDMTVCRSFKVTGPQSGPCKLKSWNDSQLMGEFESSTPLIPDSANKSCNLTVLYDAAKAAGKVGSCNLAVETNRAVGSATPANSPSDTQMVEISNKPRSDAPIYACYNGRDASDVDFGEVSTTGKTIQITLQTYPCSSRALTGQITPVKTAYVVYEDPINAAFEQLHTDDFDQGASQNNNRSTRVCEEYSSNIGNCSDFVMKDGTTKCQINVTFTPDPDRFHPSQKRICSMRIGFQAANSDRTSTHNISFKANHKKETVMLSYSPNSGEFNGEMTKELKSIGVSIAVIGDKTAPITDSITLLSRTLVGEQCKYFTLFDSVSGCGAGTTLDAESKGCEIGVALNRTDKVGAACAIEINYTINNSVTRQALIPLHVPAPSGRFGNSITPELFLGTKSSSRAFSFGVVTPNKPYQIDVPISYIAPLSENYLNMMMDDANSTLPPAARVKASISGSVAGYDCKKLITLAYPAYIEDHESNPIIPTLQLPPKLTCNEGSGTCNGSCNLDIAWLPITGQRPSENELSESFEPSETITASLNFSYKTFSDEAPELYTKARIHLEKFCMKTQHERNVFCLNAHLGEGQISPTPGLFCYTTKNNDPTMVVPASAVNSYAMINEVFSEFSTILLYKNFPSSRQLRGNPSAGQNQAVCTYRLSGEHAGIRLEYSFSEANLPTGLDAIFEYFFKVNLGDPEVSE